MHARAGAGAGAQDLCVDVVAANFEQKPTFGALPAKDVKNIVNLLSLDLPLELVGTVSPPSRLGKPPTTTSAAQEKRGLTFPGSSVGNAAWVASS